MSLYRNLLEDTIFVYGSDLSGAYISDDAAFAARYYGADTSVLEGPNGKSYALPIQDGPSQAIANSDIQWYVEQFLAHARTQREAQFQVSLMDLTSTQSVDSLAAFFKKTSDNVFLPARWLSDNLQLDRLRLYVDGDDDMDMAALVQSLNDCTAPWKKRFEVITTGTGKCDQAIRTWARQQDVPWTPFPEDKNLFGGDAALALDRQLSWYCTHALSYGAFNISHQRMAAFQKSGLKVKQLRG